MPTLEERVSKLEQDFTRFRTDAKEAYQEMAMHVTVTRGLAENALERLVLLDADMKNGFARLQAALDVHIEASNAHFDLLQKRADKTDKRLDAIETRLDRVEGVLNEHTMRLDRVEGVLNEHTMRLDRVEGTLNEHTAVLNEHTARFDRMEALLGEILTRLPEKA